MVKLTKTTVNIHFKLHAFIWQALYGFKVCGGSLLLDLKVLIQSTFLWIIRHVEISRGKAVWSQWGVNTGTNFFTFVHQHLRLL